MNNRRGFGRSLLAGMAALAALPFIPKAKPKAKPKVKSLAQTTTTNTSVIVTGSTSQNLNGEWKYIWTSTMTLDPPSDFRVDYIEINGKKYPAYPRPELWT